ncbi:MAG: putative porin [Bacteroidota bacterium]
MTRNFIFIFIVLVFSVYQAYSQIDEKNEVSKSQLDSVPEDKVVSWEIDNYYDTNRVVIDTNYFDRHLFNPNLGNVYLSSYGTPLISNDFSGRSDYEFLFNRYVSDYFLNSSTANYYRTNTPFTYLNFDTGGNDDAESRLKLFHTQNVNKHLNFGVDATIISSQKFYERETSLKSHHIILFSSYEDTTYQLFANVITNKSAHNHIGGVEDVKEIQTAGYLDDATTTVNSQEINLQQRYFFRSHRIKEDTAQIADTTAAPETQSQTDTTSSVKDSSNLDDSSKIDSSDGENKNKNGDFGFIRDGFGVLHDFSYRVYDHKYEDNEVFSDFYQPYPVYIDSSKTRDKASQNVLTNRVSLFFKSKHFDVNAGLEHNYTNYSYIYPFESEDTVINKHDMSDEDYNSFRFNGNIQLEWKDNFSFKGSLDSWFFGYHKGDLDMKVELRKDFSNAHIIASGRYYLKEPDYFLSQYNSNYFSWNNSFDKKNKLSIDLEYVNDRLDFKARLQPMMIKNHIYIDTTATPNQHKPWLRYFSVAIEKDFHFWKFHLKNDLQYQFSEYKDVLRVPSFYVHQSLALRHRFNFKVTGGKLDAQLGIAYYYYSGYKADAYMPALNLFYHQDEDIIGDQPLVNVFANFKLKRTSFYFKAFHANSFLHQNPYYSAPDYPISDIMLKVGILWSFYD